MILADANHWGDHGLIAVPHGKNGPIYVNNSSYFWTKAGTRPADLGAVGGNVGALDGSVVWKTGDEKLTHASPTAATIGGARQVIFFLQSGLVAVDTAKVDAIARGRSPVSNVADADVAVLRNDGRLDASTDPRVLDSADVAVICVPTPLTSSGGPDLQFVEAAGTTIARHLHPGMLVVLQSTCGPGTTTKVVSPLLERISDLRAGEDFFVVFAPERIDPGNMQFNVKNTAKLVGTRTAPISASSSRSHRSKSIARLKDSSSSPTRSSAQRATKNPG